MSGPAASPNKGHISRSHRLTVIRLTGGGPELPVGGSSRNLEKRRSAQHTTIHLGATMSNSAEGACVTKQLAAQNHFVGEIRTCGKNGKSASISHSHDSQVLCFELRLTTREFHVAGARHSGPRQRLSLFAPPRHIRDCDSYFTLSTPLPTPPLQMRATARRRLGEERACARLTTLTNASGPLSPH